MNADMANASFTAPMVATSEVLLFRLTVTDDDGAAASDSVRITVNNVPQPPPVITLTGDNPLILGFSEAYTELGATATDSRGADISASIVIDASTVDSSVPGEYLVTYDVSDSSGNAAETVTRTVTVMGSARLTDLSLTVSSLDQVFRAESHELHGIGERVGL